MKRKTDLGYREDLKNLIINGIKKCTTVKDYRQRGYYYWCGDENFEMDHDLYEKLYEEVIVELDIVEEASKYDAYLEYCLKNNITYP